MALALLGIVGLASSAFAWHSTEAALGAPTAALRVLASIGGVVLVVALLLSWAVTPKAPRRKKRRRTIAREDFDGLGRSLWTAGKTVAVVLLAVALFCLAALPLLSRSSAPAPSATDRPPISTGPPHSKTRRAGHSVNLGWLVLPMAFTFAVLGPAAFLIRRRWLEQTHAIPAEDPGSLGRAVRASIAALESERDPRRAILRAYSRMEHAFSDVEIVRARDETASEFLVRAMRRLRVSAGAAAALTERFEDARFSAHVVTEGDRGLALASLHRVEQELDKSP